MKLSKHYIVEGVAIKSGSTITLQEHIYGNMATVFHRTSVSNLINAIYTEGFKPGDGDFYGKGFYSTYELDSQVAPSMEMTYGNIIVKFAIPIQTFFIFDFVEFIKAPQYKVIERKYKTTIDESNFLKFQFEYFGMDYKNFDFDIKPKYTSNQAKWCTENIKNFQRLCEGIIFTGSRDGQVLAAYNTKLLMPLSYSSNDGATWESVDKNYEYLRKVSLVKNRFMPDLTKKPEEYGIYDYTFDDYGRLNVVGDVNLSSSELGELPFRFGKVAGFFNCSGNVLKSLKGSPYWVSGHFNCGSNELTSLEGSPEKCFDFYCDYNNLITLKGCTPSVGGVFNCSFNKLTSLEGGPSKVDGVYDCHENKLTTLKGSPTVVHGGFDCSYNYLTNLEGGPEVVKNGFNCKANKLTSLKGSPKSVGESFYCSNNNLTTLEGISEHIGGRIACNNNPLQSIKGIPKGYDVQDVIHNNIKELIDNYIKDGE